MNWAFELSVAYPVKHPCPACGGQLKRWWCRCFCMDCREIVHFSFPLEATGWKYSEEKVMV